MEPEGTYLLYLWFLKYLVSNGFVTNDKMTEILFFLAKVVEDRLPVPGQPWQPHGQ
jgi:hypothetical protein